MAKSTVRLVVFVIFGWLFFSPSFAQEGAVTWLQGRSQIDGNISTANDIGNPFQSTGAAFEALIAAGATTHPVTQHALQYLNSSPPTTVERISTILIANARVNSISGPLVNELLARQNADGGFADILAHTSTLLDTALALRALALAAPDKATAIQRAVSFLINRQRSSGAWADAANADNVYTTARVVEAIAALDGRFSAAVALTSARDFILALKSVDGRINSVLETAVVIAAIAPITFDRTTYSDAVTWLESQQSPDGSWANDVYLTATAYYALKRVAEANPQDPSRARIIGTLRDAVTSDPIIGATVLLTGSSTVAVDTDAAGTFDIKNIAPGNVTLTVSHTDHLSVTANAVLSAGQTLDFSPVLPRDPAPKSLSIVGVLVDKITAAPIASATVSVVGTSVSTISDSTGAFLLNEIPAGAASLILTAPGYTAATYQVIAGSGGVMNLGNVELSASAFPSSTGSLTGLVVDAIAQTPLRGVSVTLDGPTARTVLTDENGRFLISDLVPAQYGVTFVLVGYHSATFAGSITAASVMHVQAALTLASNSALATLSGTVIDQSNNTPLGQVTVRAPALGLDTLTDALGTFKITNLPVGPVQLVLQYAGYDNASVSTTVPAAGAYSVGTLSMHPTQPLSTNRPPIISSVAPAQANAGYLYVYAITATDPENQPLTYWLETAPSGMVIDPQTGVVSWLPTLQHGNAVTYSVSVGDTGGAIASQTVNVTISLTSLSYVVTDLPTLQGLEVNTTLPTNYVMSRYYSGATDTALVSQTCVGYSAISSPPAPALAALDYRSIWLVTAPDLVTEFTTPQHTIAVVSLIDHEPFPHEGVEVTVWGADDPNAPFPIGWKMATLVSIYKRGFAVDPACTAPFVTDDYSGLYNFGGQSYRYVRLRANYSISIFNEVAHTTWSNVQDDGGEPGWQSYEAEIDGVVGMLCTAPPIAQAGSDLTGVTGAALQLDATASQGAIQTYAWDIDGDSTIDLTGARPIWTPTSRVDRDVRLFVVDQNGCTASDTVHVVVDASIPRPDLTITRVDSASVRVDAQTFAATGVVQIHVANRAPIPIGAPFTVTVFEDTDHNSGFDSGTDTVLGRARHEATLDRGGNLQLSIPIAGTLSFRDNRLHAMVDSAREIVESDETNNIEHDVDPCSFTTVSCNLFEDNFEDGNATGWTLTSLGSNPADWQVTNGEFTGIAGIALHTTTERDYALHARVRIAPGSTARSGLVIRHQDGDHDYRILFGLNRIRLVEHVNGFSTTVAEVTPTLAADTWHTVLALVRGRTLKVLVSGNVMLEFRNLNVPTGHPGVIADGEPIRIDDVRLETCTVNDYATTIAPTLQWHWTGSFGIPGNHLLSVPVVTPLEDTNGDGVVNTADEVAVIFHSFSNSIDNNGRLHAVRGRDGAPLWSVTNPLYSTDPAANLAIGDIDNDGFVEIIAPRDGGGLIAFEHDGTFKWFTPFRVYVKWGAPSLADLDGDGVPEIIVGNTVFNADGALRWQGTGFAGVSVLGNWGPVSIVADINLDGLPEVIAGGAAYSNTGQLLWQNATIGEGFTAVGNFDDDPYPEIVVNGFRKIALLDHLGNLIWGPIPFPGFVDNHGGHPVVADLDGDGFPEIAVSGGSLYAVFRADGSLMWTAPIADTGSSMTSSTAFDLNGDGIMEIMYADQVNFHIFNGLTGQRVYFAPNSSVTTYEGPSVADIDGDGHAEILVGANGTQFGLRAYTNVGDDWMPARALWNQHSYHDTNITDSGRIPAHEQNSWTVHNTYRVNVFDTTPVTTVHAAVDLTVGKLTFQNNGAGSLTASVRVGNGGDGTSPVVELALYEGAPNNGGRRLGTTTVAALDPGHSLDIPISLTSTLTGASDVFVLIDAADTVSECNESNNLLRLPVLPQTVSATIQASTDHTQYGAGTPAQLRARLTNTNSLPGMFKANLAVYDSQGAQIATFGPLTTGVLAGNTDVVLTQTWNTGAYLTGDYVLRAQALSLDGSVIDTDTAAFKIIATSAQPGTAAALRVTTDQPVYNIDSTVALTGLVQNLSSNTLLTGTEIELEVIDPTNESILVALLTVRSLPAGTSDIRGTTLRLTNGTPGSYSVNGRLRNASTGELLALGNTSFAVVKNIGVSITGQVTAAFPSVRAGTVQVCTDTVRNRGSTAVTALALRQAVVMFDTNAEISLTPTTTDIAAQSDATLIRNIVTTGLAVGSYACALQAHVNNAWQTLGFAPFTVTHPLGTIEAELTLGQRGRLLVLLDHDDNKSDDHESDDDHANGGDEDDHDDDHTVRKTGSTTAQRAFLETLLNAAGWKYTLVTRAQDFEREFHRGGYTVYALFSEHEKLSESFQHELREAVFNGDGLLIAGDHDERNGRLAEALGLEFRGHTRRVPGVRVQTPLLPTLTTVLFQSPREVTKVSLTTAQSLGIFLGAERNTLPAVVRHNYGYGRSAYIAFDALDETTRESDVEGPFAQLLRALVADIHPATLRLTETAVVPVTLTLRNTGVVATGHAALTLDPGLSLVSIHPGTLTDIRHATVPFQLATEQTSTVTLWVRIDTPITLQPKITAAIQTSAPTAGTVTTVTLTLDITPTVTISEIQTSASNLVSTGDPAAKRALVHITQAAHRIAANQPAQALKALLQATDKLVGNAAPGITALRRQLDDLIRLTARKLAEGGSR